MQHKLLLVDCIACSWSAWEQIGHTLLIRVMNLM
jgi:hypothetical protein